MSYAGKPRDRHGSLGDRSDDRAPASTPGKQTLVEPASSSMVQRRSAERSAPRDETTTRAAASRGIATPGSSLPFSAAVQRAFGRHDISSIQADVGIDAASSVYEMGAEAYATGDHVVLGPSPDLH